MDIYKLSIGSGENIFYSKGFMDVLESHMNYFRTSSNSNVVQVDPKKTSIYNGDLFGYLNEIGISQKYHWVIMRINNMFCNSDFGSNVLSLTVPDQNEIEQIRSAYVATGVISL